MSDETPTTGDEPVITNKERLAWNDYVKYLDKKGIKGKPELDKDGLGFKALEDYRKEHPDTPITKELIPVIQKDFSKYRDYSLDIIKNKKVDPQTGHRMTFGPGVTEDNFMTNLSQVDGYPGSKTTSFAYPNYYLQTLENGQVKQTEDKGFATVTKL